MSHFKIWQCFSLLKKILSWFKVLLCDDYAEYWICLTHLLSRTARFTDCSSKLWDSYSHLPLQNCYRAHSEQSEISIHTSVGSCHRGLASCAKAQMRRKGMISISFTLCQIHDCVVVVESTRTWLKVSLCFAFIWVARVNWGYGSLHRPCQDSDAEADLPPTPLFSHGYSAALSCFPKCKPSTLFSSRGQCWPHHIFQCPDSHYFTACSSRHSPRWCILSAVSPGTLLPCGNWVGWPRAPSCSLALLAGRGHAAPTFASP